MTYIPIINNARLGANAVTSNKVLDGTLTDADVAAANKDGLVGVASLRTIGTGALQAMAGNTTLSSIAAPTGSVSLNSQKITNLADGTAASDAVNFGQLSAVAVGVVDWKTSARIVTTTNDTLSGLAARDGVTPVGGDRVLVTGQTTGADNGIYVAAAGAWSRSTDADSSAEVTAGLALMVTEGTAGADTLWVLATNDPIVLGTTSLSFVQLPSLRDLVAGGGLTKTGVTLDVGAGTGITVNANDVAVNTAVVATLGTANTFTANQTFAGINFATRTETANYSVNVNTDHTILANSTGGTIAIDLPASHTLGDTVVVKDKLGTTETNAITVTTADADTIDGAASYALQSNFESVEVRSDGTNWFVV